MNTCPRCGSTRTTKYGHESRTGMQRHHCKDCGRKYSLGTLFPSKFRITDEKFDELREAFASGATIRKAAARAGAAQDTVVRVFRRLREGAA